MKYIYTMDMCSACVELKVVYDAQGIEYVERDGDRLKNPKDVDDIDKKAFAQLAFQGNVFPVEVEG